MSDTTQELQEVLDEFEGSDFQVSPLDAPAKTENGRSFGWGNYSPRRIWDNGGVF